jgi:hypothetical protein
MEEAIKTLNLLKKDGLLQDYALCGGIALVYYIEPLLTYDLDVLFIPKKEERDRIDFLSGIYKYLRDRGFKESKEHIIIGDMPVQLIPTSNRLTKEAVEKAKEVGYYGCKTRVVEAEYLLAIMLQTFRPKDKERIGRFLEEYKFDWKVLNRIIENHRLNNRFDKIVAASWKEKEKWRDKK